ncbi:Ubiquitin-conjugating enzyme E2 J1 [Linnemannia zychae]|nr:Ubiquitin-conjugating enzyme E2 J1 [Linnemannia zychae]
MASLAGIPAQYNKKSSAVKRIMQEAKELDREPSTDFSASPLETDIFEWHFTIRGPEETEFEGGLYHGRILLPNNYPFAPPSLMFLTPNGRFELNKKVCLSITGYHPEYWQPAWGIRTVLVAVMGFLPTESKGAIGGLDTSIEARKALATRSRTWVCQTCHSDMVSILPDVAPENVVKASLKADEMPPEFSFGYEADKKKATEKDPLAESNAEESESNKSNNQTQTVDGKESETNHPSSPKVTAPDHTSRVEETKILVNKAQEATLATFTLLSTDSVKQQESTSKATSSTGSTPKSMHNNSVPSQTTTDLPAPLQHPTQRTSQTQQQMQRANSSPIWLDILIIGFGGVLVALVVKRFFM